MDSHELQKQMDDDPIEKARAHDLATLAEAANICADWATGASEPEARAVFRIADLALREARAIRIVMSD